MRESIGGISLFQIVVIFLLLFTAVMCFTINHSRAFAVKDEVISIIENSTLNSTVPNQKITDATINDIFDRLTEIGYRTFGNCPDDTWTGYVRNGNAIQTSNTSAANVLFCIKEVDVADEYRNDVGTQCPGCTVVGSSDYPYMYYYNVMLFYQLDVPVVNKMNFNIVSSTKVIFASRNNKKAPGCYYGQIAPGQAQKGRSC